MIQLVPLEFWFSRPCKSNPGPEITEKQREQRNKVVATGYYVPKLMYSDSSEDADYVFNSVEKLNNGDTKVINEDFWSAFGRLERRHIGINVDIGSLRRDAFIKFNKQITAKLDNLTGIDKCVVVTRHDEVVNGYKLYDYEGTFYSMKQMMEYVKEWNTVADSGKDMTYEEFKDKINVCSDWGKMDEHGNSFGGFWLSPKGTPQYENAYTLSLKANLKALYDLPFPKKLLIQTVSMGCSMRRESVRDSNFYMILFQRQVEQYKNFFQSVELRALSSEL